MASSIGEPIHLVRRIEDAEDDDMRFELNPELSQRMLHVERLKRTKVCVISVAGAFRKGKSFLLNFFLKYFRTISRECTTEWMLEESSVTDGFHWRAGSERDTTGILVWSEPFFIRKPSGEEVAVLLMDTQGTFDHQSTQKDCATIFGFSTLLSSVQIFNISQQIQETDLQYLRLFVEFAAMARNSKEKVLQHLWFLVRDWQNPDEYEFGTDGGKKYLDKVLSCDSSKPRQNQELRQGIKQHFQQASCCLLPHPGLVVTRSSYRGDLSQLESEFKDELKQFIPAIASKRAISAKKVNGKELTGNDLFEYVEVYFKAFSSGRVPSPKSIFAATVEMANMAAAHDAKEFFENSMFAFVGEDIPDDEFDGIMLAILMQALQQFTDNCMESDSLATNKTMEKLQDELREICERQKVLRQLQSQKMSADKKNAMLQQEIGSMHEKNVEVYRKMQSMESDYRRKLEEIRKQSISKEEMERLLKEESMRHATARRVMARTTEQMEAKMEELVAANQELQDQLSEGQRRAQWDFQNRLWEQKSEMEDMRNRVRELEDKDESGCTLL